MEKCVKSKSADVVVPPKKGVVIADWREIMKESLTAKAARMPTSIPSSDRLEIDLDTGMPCYPDNVQERGREVVMLAFATDGAFVAIALALLDNPTQDGIVVYKTPDAGAKRISAFIRAHENVGVFSYSASLGTYRSESRGKSYWNVQLTHECSISDDEDLMSKIADLLPAAESAAAEALEFSPAPPKGALMRKKKF
jgi:hypothetical protein